MKRLGYWRQVVVMGILVMGLSGFFALPALLEKGYTQADQLTTGFSNYNHHFLYIRQLWNSAWGYGGSIWGIDDNVTFEIGKIHVVLLALVMVMTGITWWKRKHQLNQVIVLGGLLALALFLTILKSKFIWDALPFMAYIQFPWRYLSVAIIFVGLLVGSNTIFVPARFRWAVSLSLSLLLIGGQFNQMKPEKFLEQDELLYYSDPVSIQTKMSGIIPDFLPETAQPKNLSVGVLPNERFIFAPMITTTTEINKGHEFLINFKANKPTVFTARIFDFPGWTLYLNGEKLTHAITPEGLIQASISAIPKESYLSGRFEETPLRAAADGLTVLSLMVVVGLCYPTLKKKETP
jgi:hypothetical protein